MKQHWSNMEKRRCPNEANRGARFDPQNTLYSYGQFRSFNNGTGVAYPQKAEQTSQRQWCNLRLKDCINLPPPLRLRLQETTIKSIRDTVNARHERTKKSAPPNNLQADFFPASVLKIGEYKFTATQEGTLVAGFYYAKQKLTWEIFDIDRRIKYKIEVPWRDILAVRAVVEENKPGILEIELAKAPTFFRHIDSDLRSHPIWKTSEDFTGGHATKYRRHYFEFPPGVLDKYFQKLIQSDNRLLELSQLPFPGLSSPFFDSCPLLDQGATDSSHNHHLRGSQTNTSSHEHTTLPISPVQVGQAGNTMSSSSLMHSTSPTLGIQFRNGNVFNNPMLLDPKLTIRSQKHAFQKRKRSQNIGDNILTAAEMYMRNLQQPSSGLHSDDENINVFTLPPKFHP